MVVTLQAKGSCLTPGLTEKIWLYYTHTMQYRNTTQYLTKRLQCNSLSQFSGSGSFLLTRPSSIPACTTLPSPDSLLSRFSTFRPRRLSCVTSPVQSSHLRSPLFDLSSRRVKKCNNDDVWSVSRLVYNMECIYVEESHQNGSAKANVYSGNSNTIQDK